MLKSLAVTAITLLSLTAHAELQRLSGSMFATGMNTTAESPTNVLCEPEGDYYRARIAFNRLEQNGNSVEIAEYVVFLNSNSPDAGPFCEYYRAAANPGWPGMSNFWRRNELPSSPRITSVTYEFNDNPRQGFIVQVVMGGQTFNL